MLALPYMALFEFVFANYVVAPLKRKKRRDADGGWHEAPPDGAATPKLLGAEEASVDDEEKLEAVHVVGCLLCANLRLDSRPATCAVLAPEKYYAFRVLVPVMGLVLARRAELADALADARASPNDAVRETAPALERFIATLEEAWDCRPWADDEVKSGRCTSYNEAVGWREKFADRTFKRVVATLAAAARWHRHPPIDRSRRSPFPPPSAALIRLVPTGRGPERDDVARGVRGEDSQQRGVRLMCMLGRELADEADEARAVLGAVGVPATHGDDAVQELVDGDDGGVWTSVSIPEIKRFIPKTPKFRVCAPRADPCPSAQEHFGEASVAVNGGVVQARTPKLGGGVDVRARGEEQLDGGV